MDTAQKIKELRKSAGMTRKRIFGAYGHSCSYSGGLGSCKTDSTGIYSKINRLSVEI